MQTQRARNMHKLGPEKAFFAQVLIVKHEIMVCFLW